MKSIFFIIIEVLSLSIVIAQKTISKYEYWFDSDYISKEIVDVSPGQTSLSIALQPSGQNLSTGLHSFHIRFMDDIGLWSTTSSSFFTTQTSSIVTDKKIVLYEYWLDNNYSEKIEVAVAPDVDVFTLSITPDYNDLADGQHIFNIRFKDNAGQWSATTSNFFQTTINTSVENNFVDAYRYWYDEDIDTQEIIELDAPEKIYSFNVNLRTSGISEGEHTIAFQFRDLNGKWSTPVLSSFYQPAELPAFEFYSIKSGDWQDPSVWSDEEDGNPILQSPSLNDTVNISGEVISVNSDTESSNINITSHPNNETVLKVTGSNLTVHGQIKLQKEAENSNKVDIIVNEGGNIECVEP